VVGGDSCGLPRRRRALPTHAPSSQTSRWYVRHSLRLYTLHLYLCVSLSRCLCMGGEETTSCTCASPARCFDRGEVTEACLPISRYPLHPAAIMPLSLHLSLYTSLSTRRVSVHLSLYTSLSIILSWCSMIERELRERGEGER